MLKIVPKRVLYIQSIMATEKIIKTKLIKLFRNDFNVIENIKGLSFYNKEVRPDLALKFNNLLFVIEIKDDTKKNFNLSHLLRQAINYKNATYNNAVPQFAFIATSNMLKIGKQAIYGGETSKMIGLANKLGVGEIFYRKSKNIISINLGSQILYEINTTTLESSFNFNSMPKLKIGTNAKSNRINYI